MDRTVLECLPTEVRKCVRAAAIACVQDDYWDIAYHLTAAVKAYCHMQPGADVMTRPMPQLLDDLATYMAITSVLSGLGIVAQHEPTPQRLRDLFDAAPQFVRDKIRTPRTRELTDLMIRLTEGVA